MPNKITFTQFCSILNSDKPSTGFEALRASGQIKQFPVLQNLIGCPQNPKWHPEGNVWIHTMMVIDNAAIVKDEVSEEFKLTYMFAALLHDIGKPNTTVLPECTARGHAEVGARLAIEFMSRFTDKEEMIGDVESLVRLHMHPGQLYKSKARENSWRRLHKKFRLDLLGFLHKADAAGRTGRYIEDVNETFESCMKYFAKFNEPVIIPIVQGKDLITAGLKPGPQFNKLLKKAFQLQMEGMEDFEEIIKALGLE